MFHEPRRARSRRKFIIPILLAIAIVTAVFVGTLGENTLAGRDFYDSTTRIALDLQSDATAFQELVTGSFAIDRDEYVAAIEQVESSLTEAIESLPLSEDVPVEVRGTRRAAATTLAAWQAGVLSFKEASLKVVDFPESGLGDGELAAAVAQLHVADEFYRVLTAEMNELRIELEIPEVQLPEVQFVPANAVTIGFITTLTGRLRSADILSGRRSLQILNVRTIPEPLGGGEDFDTDRLPFTETIEVQVVIVNDGNVAEENLSIVLSIGNVDTLESSQFSETIDRLEPNSERVVSFPDLPVEAGQAYRLTVRTLTDEVVDLEGPGAETFEIFISENAEIPDETTTTAP